MCLYERKLHPSTMQNVLSSPFFPHAYMITALNFLEFSLQFSEHMELAPIFPI